jgi:hypothetical protein
MVSIYGDAPKAVRLAIAKVWNAVGAYKPPRVFWDSGETLGRMKACNEFMAERDGLDDDAVAYQVRVFPSKEVFLDEREVAPVVCHLDLLKIAMEMERDRPVRERCWVVSVVEDALFRLCGRYREEKAEGAMHESAIKHLWEGEVDFVEKKKAVNPSVLLVDDRVTLKGSSGYGYCVKAARKLEEDGCTVFLAESTSTARRGVFWKYDVAEEALIRWTIEGCFDFRIFDLVLLDIVQATDGVGEKKYWGGSPSEREVLDLAGIQRDLLAIARERSVLPFPQIYMLSNLRREVVGHLCFSSGADYYLQKGELLRNEPFDLRRILRHTVRTARGADVGELGVEREYARVCSFEGWSPDKVFGAKAAKKMGRRRSSNDCAQMERLAYRLYSQAHRLSGLVMQNRLTGGLSGAATLKVQPHDSRGTLRPRVLKVDDRYDVANEYRAYFHYIEPYMSRGFVRVERIWAVSGKKGAISYEYAGDQYEPSKGDIAPLLDMIGMGKSFAVGRGEGGNRDAVTSLLGEVFEALQRLHGDNRCKTLWDIWRYFREEMSALKLQKWRSEGGDEFEIIKVKDYDEKRGGPRKTRIGRVLTEEKRLDDVRTWVIGEETEKLGPGWLIRPGKRFFLDVFEHEGQGLFPDPLSMISKLSEEKRTKGFTGKRIHQAALCVKEHNLIEKLEGLARRHLADSVSNDPTKVQWGVVHGDLHPGNIMVDPRKENNFWLIDYGRTRKGPPVIDYVVFEAQIRFLILSPLLGCMVGETSSAEKWTAEVCERVKLFEDALSRDGEARPMRLSWKDILGEESATVVYDAIAVIRFVRNLAKKYLSCDGSDEWHIQYSLSLFLFMIRGLQVFRGAVTAAWGPVGAIWAAEVAGRCYKSMTKSGSNHQTREL